MTALALPVRRALTDVTIGRGAVAFWLCVPLVLAGLLIVRDSSLVAVQDVRIVGLGGYYEANARESLRAEALTMSTLNVDDERLGESLAQFVDVSGLRTATDFPHGLTVYVAVRRPVASARIGSRVAGVTAGGQVLESARELSLVPRIEIEGPVRDGRVIGTEALASLKLLGGAPDVMLRQVKSVKSGPRGLTVVLDKGTQLLFGSSAMAELKWRSAAAVLADPTTAGVKYIDLRIADRPALGGLGPAPITPKPADELPTPTTPAEVQAGAGTPGSGPSATTGPVQAPPPPAAQQPVTTPRAGGGIAPGTP